MKHFFNEIKIKLGLKKGFTLIELLVVISIIGVLASMILVSMGDVRAKARDARRKTDIAQIRKALELYYVANSAYPTGGWLNSNLANWDTLKAALSPYISLPADPTNTPPLASPAVNYPWTANTYIYSYYSNGYGCTGQWYMIVYRLEKPDITSPGVKACDGTNFNYGGTITAGMNQK